MAIVSFPFDGVVVSETNFSRLFRELQDSGIADDANTGTGFKVTANGATMVLTVAPGVAIVRGHAIVMDAAVTVSIAAAAASARIDRVVLRLDPAANSITPLALTGTAGAGSPPALAATDTGTFDLPLAIVSVAPGTTALSTSMVTDDRRYLGGRVGIWRSDAQRPSSPRFGRMGFNIGQARFEYWNGTAWVAVSSAVDWSSITNKPTSYPPSAHTHVWNDLSDKPTSFTPSTHGHDWAAITNAPASFPPTAHTHNYAALSHVHNYANAQHTHAGQNIVTAVSRANGSDRPRAETPEGSGWFAVWVDGNNNFCRNTSSIKYKENVKDHNVDPAKVLALQPRKYDRRGGVNAQKGEYGLIAEEVNQTLPEIVILHDGEIDSIRYDLLSVALLDVVKAQHSQLANLTARIEALEGQ